MKQFHSFRVFSSLAASAFVLFACLIDVQAVVAQQLANILWAHGSPPPGDGVVTSLHASKIDRMIFAGSLDSWWICSLHPVSLSYSGDAPQGGGTASVLVRHDSELIIASNGICALEVNGRQLSTICSLGADYISATPDGNIIAAFTEGDWLVHLYDRIAGKEIATWPNARGAVQLSPDGKLLLAAFDTGSTDIPLALIDIATRQIIHLYTNVFIPSAIIFNPVKLGVFAVADNSGVMEMDTSGNVHASWPVSTTTGNDVISYSPDGSVIAAGSQPILLLNPSNGSSNALPGGAAFVSFLDNDTLAATDGENAYLFSTKQQTYLGQLNESSMFIGSLAYSKDGTKLFDGFNLWDASTGNLLSTNSRGGNPFAVASDLSRMVVPGGQGTLWLYKSLSDTGVIIPGTTVNTDTSYRTNVVFSPSDSSFISASSITDAEGFPVLDSRNAIQFRSALDGSIIRQFDAPLYPASSLSFSRDGSMLIGMVNDVCYLWDVSTGQQIKTLGNNIPWMEASAVNVAFLPGDTTVVIGCDSHTGEFVIDRISDDSSYFVQTPVENMDGTISVLPDGRHFAEIDNRDPNRLDIFDLENGTLDTLYVNNGENFSAFAANPIIGEIATGGYNGWDGSLIVWNNPFATDAVKQISVPFPQPLEAFASNSHIKIDLPIGAESGHVFVYRTDGRCFFSSGLEAGESSVTTSELPSGVYFIVYEPSSGARAFTKVSLFE